ncbi:MAG: class I SAM-dependent methyltransferase [Candidatus Electrothrix aestuarii]|uniref:Class I SAM-dependent methyltransferase n=1 Tax=Candidatus Electrothrix aestuarii TaxID=3062594 RepID=A0AAU8LYC7_9BACT|nr:class I SAM-dependent methyltransferase [Candidatus Electrothrix aestuarii]
MSIPSNYEFFLTKVPELSPAGGRILDYGCGKGTLVEEGIRRKIDFWGCELFGSGSGTAIRQELRQKGLLDERVREISEGTIPFPDSFFDLVVSNQVFEHVPSLSAPLEEIARTLKPSGKLLCVFPTMECYRDHAGTLFAHKFAPYSKAQYYNLLFFRLLGFGRLKKGRGTPREWTNFFVNWLAQNTWYRSHNEIHEAFNKYFVTYQHVEEEYLSFRLKEKGWNLAANLAHIPFGKLFFRWVVTRWGGVVLLAEKSSGNEITVAI